MFCFNSYYSDEFTDPPAKKQKPITLFEDDNEKEEYSGFASVIQLESGRNVSWLI